MASSSSVLACCWLLIAMPARADDTAVFRAFGLEGVFADDCRLPPAPDNAWISYDWPPGGPIRHRVTFDGRTLFLQDSIADAVRLSPTMMRFTVIRQGKAALVVTTERLDDTRYHTVESVTPDGVVYFREGIALSTGKQSQVFEACEGSALVS